MALPERQPSNEVVVTSPQMADLGTAGSVYSASPVTGRLVRAYSVVQSTVGGSNATWSMEVNGTAITGTATVTASGSAAGDVDEVIFSPPIYVNKGDTLEWISGGECDSTTIAQFSAVIRT